MIGNDRMKKLEKNSELRRDLLICGHIDTVAMLKSCVLMPHIGSKVRCECLINFHTQK